jgi:hypothetical protein
MTDKRLKVKMAPNIRLIKEKVILTWVIRPDIFNTFIYLTFILDFLQVLNDFQRSTGSYGKIDQFIF